MSAPLFGIYGASGCGRGIMPIAREAVISAGAGHERLVFVDDAPQTDSVNGHSIMTYAAFKTIAASARHVAIAIANGAVRQRLAAACAADGIALWSLKAANVIMMDDVNIGEGALLSPFVTLTSNIVIGRCFHANLYSYVEHDCRIGDYVTFAPGVKCNGNVVIDDFAYIGTGAILRQGQPGKPLVIGRGAVVGMGAVVTKDVPPGETVVGNPARPLRKDL